MPKISVIVTIYNLELYLEQCLDSLVNQSLKDIEILLINDGSKDRSQEIIDKYKKKHQNISSYNTDHVGPGEARNLGLKKAKGKYISFIDGDDWIEKDMLEKLYNKIVSKDFDFVACDLTYRYEDSKKDFKHHAGLFYDIIKDNDKLKEYLLTIYPVIWNKLYKKELFHKIQFKKEVWFEDVELLYRLLPNVEKIGYVGEHLYNYRRRSGAITASINSKLYDYIDNWNGIIEFYKKTKIYKEYKEEIEYCYVKYLYATFLRKASKYSEKEYKKAYSIAKKNVKNTVHNLWKNKYFYKSFKGIYLLFFNKVFVKMGLIILKER